MISDRPTVAYAPTQRRKLIEVDLPLDDINVATEQEPTSRHLGIRGGCSIGGRGVGGWRPAGPSSLPAWWMTHCPAATNSPRPRPETAERKRLHKIIKRLVVWENSGDEALLAEARYEIARSVARARGETAPH